MSFRNICQVKVMSDEQIGQSVGPKLLEGNLDPINRATRCRPTSETELVRVLEAHSWAWSKDMQCSPEID